MEFFDFHPELKKLKGLAQIKWWIKHVFLDACSRDIRTIDSVLEDFPADVLVGDSVSLGVFFKSEMGGPPSAEISLLPLALASRDTAPFGSGLLPGTNILTKTRNRMLNFVVYQILFRDVTHYASATRQKLGLAPLHGTFLRARFEIPSLVVHISTPAFEYYRSDQPEHVRFIGPVIPDPDPTYDPPCWWPDLSESRPVVLANQGTLATNLEDLIVPTISALKDERMLVISVPVKDGQLGDLPENVRAEPYIPFDHLLPHVDVMITNGGYGGVQWALSQGIPLVVAGEAEDKMEVAGRVEWTGTGVNLRKKRPSPNTIRNAVSEVLTNPKFRDNARRIQSDFAKYDAPTRAAELLEALGRRRRRVKIFS
jgi:UDP:flavonoid glycosyltransferase YjiC (YdhE family)